jgi:hypothetical protein
MHCHDYFFQCVIPHALPATASDVPNRYASAPKHSRWQWTWRRQQDAGDLLWTHDYQGLYLIAIRHPVRLDGKGLLALLSRVRVPASQVDSLYEALTDEGLDGL